MYRNDVFLVLLGLSCFCVLVLVGLFLYHGSIFPATHGATGSELVMIVGLWVSVAGVPIITLFLAILRRMR